MKDRWLRLFFLTFGVLSIMASCLPSRLLSAPSDPNTVPFSLTAAGQRLPTIVFTGATQNCAITVYNSGGGFTIIPQAADDAIVNGATNPTPSWTTATTLNSGSISATGSFHANVSSNGITAFGGYLSALTSGTVTGTIGCGPSNGAQPQTSAAATANQLVNCGAAPGCNVHDAAPVQPSPLYTNQVNTPPPAPTCSPGLGLCSQMLGPSTAPAVINGAYLAVVDSNGRIAGRVCDATTSTQCLAISAGGVASVHDAAPVQPSPIYTEQVNTPAPAPTCTPGLYQCATLAGPSTAPAAVNGAYLAVVDSNGRIAGRVCDATTSTQCLAITAAGVASMHDAAPVQPSPLYTNQVNTPAPAPTCSPGLGVCSQVLGPSTAPAAINGAYLAVVDSNGRIAGRVCDATTSTQCLAVTAGGVASVHDAAPVQPSPLYTQPVSGTVTANIGTGGDGPRYVNASGTIVSNTTVAVFTAAQLAGMNSCFLNITSTVTGTVTGQIVDTYTNNPMSSTVNVTAGQTFTLNAFPGMYNAYNIGIGGNVGLYGISLTTTNYVANSGTLTWQAYCSTVVPPPGATNATPFVAAITTTATQFIAAPANGAIHILSISGAGYDTATGGIVELEYGTGSSCTSPTIVAYLMVMPAALTQGGGDNFAYGNGTGTVVQVPAGKNLCVLTSGGTVGVAGIQGVYVIY